MTATEQPLADQMDSLAVYLSRSERVTDQIRADRCRAAAARLRDQAETLAECVKSLEVCAVAGPRPGIGRLTDEKNAAVRRARALLGKDHDGRG